MGAHHFAGAAICAALVVTPFSATSATTTTSAETAAGGVRITRITFDPPGNDLPATNWKLNQEWIRITNKGTAARTLTGWTVRDAGGHVYKFGTFKLKAGKSVRIHTGKGTNTGADRYWRMENYVWNNTGDTATLKNAAGTKIDRCSYNGAGSSVAC